jgi:hypothetical protein
MATSPESPAEPIKFTGKGPVHYFPATQGIVVGSPVVLKGLVNSDHVRKFPHPANQKQLHASALPNHQTAHTKKNLNRMFSTMMIESARLPIHTLECDPRLSVFDRGVGGGDDDDV